MMHETSRSRFDRLRTSWMFSLGFVWGGELVSTLTSSILQMGLVWHIALATDSPSLLSLASLVGFLPMALLGPIAGVIVDRLPLKRVLVSADLFIAGVSATLAFVVFMGEDPVWVIIAALFVRAIGTSFYTPASQSLTPHLAPSEHLVRLSGVTQAVQSGGYMMGAALAAVIYPIGGLAPMIVLDVVGALFASVAVLFARIQVAGRVEHRVGSSLAAAVRGVLSDALDAYRVLGRFPGLAALLWCGFAFTLAFSPLTALFPIMTLSHFGKTTGDAALVEILFSIGMLAGSGMLATTGGFRNRAYTMAAGISGFGCAAIISGLVDASLFVAFLPMSFIMGACSPLYSGPQTALIQERVPAEYLGRVFGLYGSIMSWALPLGLAMPSLVADHMGAQIWFVGSGMAIALLAVVMLLIPSVRDIGKQQA